MTLSRRDVTLSGAAGLVALSAPAVLRAQQAGTPDFRAIAKDAYVYGFPLVDNYRVQHAYFVDRSNPEFKAPFNQLVNIGRVYTPEDRAIQTPNSDTPYSMLGLDLRAEPIVLTIPPIEAGRYFSVQLIDAYTFNFDYIGSRATGNGGGNFMVAGPGWQGETPPGVAKVFRSETQFGIAAYRTQLFNPADIDAVHRVQAGYRAAPLSTFLGQPALASARPVDFPAPLTPEQQRTSLDFYKILNFVLRHAPTDPSERELRARFASIGLDPERNFDPAQLSPEARTAMTEGMADAWREFGVAQARVTAGEVTSGELFGTRAFLRNNYMYRMLGAVLGIYGNSREEAIYPLYRADAAGQPLNGTNRYQLRFAANALPPVEAFWSVTMYNLPESLLVANPINRYLINSPMLPQLRRDADGGLTIEVAHTRPTGDAQANWLPAPAGPFWIAMRLYWPKPEAITGAWRAPPLQRA